MNKLLGQIKENILLIAIVAGVASYLIYHFTPALRPIGPVCNAIASYGQTISVALILFLQFVKVSPSQIRLRRWNTWIVLIQISGLLIFGFLCMISKSETWRIFFECMMLAFICPTATASGVIAQKIGGNVEQTVSYVILINCIVTVLIPVAIPIIHPENDINVLATIGSIALKIFPLLILPALLAWFVRYFIKPMQSYLEKHSIDLAFKIWAIGLYLALVLATKSLVDCGLPFITILSIVIASLLSCISQFFIGRKIGKTYDDKTRLNAGQALGHKNNGFLIWLSYSYMTPVTSVAGGLYAIWQNIFNAWQLQKQKK